MGLDKATILAAINAASDIKTEKVNVPEWKTDVYLKVLTGTERDVFEATLGESRLSRGKFLVLTLCDEDGNRLFTDEQVEVLNKRSSLVLNRLFERSWKINMLSAEAADEAGESSGGGPKNASTTD